MSAGHRSKPADEIPDGLYDRTRALVANATIDRSYDVQTLANRSRDGTTVYEDKDLPDVLPKCGIRPDETLPWHELSEWLMQNDGDKYPAAHAIATAVEKQRVEELGGDWKEYTAEMDGFIEAVDKKFADQTDLDPPPDQDERVFESKRASMRAEKTWFSIRADLSNTADTFAEIMVYDEIGGWGKSATDFDRELKACGDVKTIKMRINSPGGDAFVGTAIHNILQRHPAKIEAHVDGMAASAASLIAMAADKIVMPENTFMVVHEPYGLCIGPASAHKAMAADLDTATDGYARTYAKRSGQKLADVKALMAEDRLMGAKECKAKGYCDELGTATKETSAKFSLDRLPEQFSSLSSLLAMKSFTPFKPEELPMSDKLLEAEAARVTSIKALGTEMKLDDKTVQGAIDAGITADQLKAVVARTGDLAGSPKPPAAMLTDAEQQEIVDVCKTAKVQASVAIDFILAKTPVAEVRKQVAAAMAAASDNKVIVKFDPNKVDDSQTSLAGVPAEAIAAARQFPASPEKGAKGADPAIVARKLEINKQLRAEETRGKRVA